MFVGLSAHSWWFVGALQTLWAFPGLPPPTRRDTRLSFSSVFLHVALGLFTSRCLVTPPLRFSMLLVLCTRSVKTTELLLADRIWVMLQRGCLINSLKSPIITTL